MDDNNLMPYENREEAARRLLYLLQSLKGKKPLVLAVPNGALPMAKVIADSLGGDLDLVLVKKISHPHFPEFALGAVCEDGQIFWGPNAPRLGVDSDRLQELAEKQIAKLKSKREALTGRLTPIDPSGRDVIIVDDGIATGATMIAAVTNLKSLGARRIVIAAPVASPQAVELLKDLDVEVQVLRQPDFFSAVGYFYRDFDQVSDAQVLSYFPSKTARGFIDEAAARATPLGEPESLRLLAARLKDARVVMLGESTHGTHEFYEFRRRLSRVLIEDHGFSFIAVEGDWPPARKVNEYVHRRENGSVRRVLSAFHRWPTWMWCNSETATLAHALRDHNDLAAAESKVSFYGLDVYSLFESMDEVLRRLEVRAPKSAATVRQRYACFDPFRRDEKAYARSLLQDLAGCETEVIENLKLMLAMHLSSPGPELFDARQNARIVANAESYYRAMVTGQEESWNVRDQHMLETLEDLLNHHGEGSKGIVWAHNTHVGDYRATDMADHGQINLGGLAREKWGDANVRLVGFGTYHGETIASHAWGGPIETMKIPPGKSGSVEERLHTVADRIGSEDYFLDFAGLANENHSPLNQTAGHRAIGVVYNPEFERFGNYVPTQLAKRYDAFVFFDKTKALTPMVTKVESLEIPETWPQGM